MSPLAQLDAKHEQQALNSRAAQAEAARQAALGRGDVTAAAAAEAELRALWERYRDLAEVRA